MPSPLPPEPEQAPTRPAEADAQGEPLRRAARGLGAWARHSAVGMQFVGTIVACGALGWGLDRWVGTGKPWFALGGLLLGIGGGMYVLIREFGRRMDD